MFVEIEADSVMPAKKFCVELSEEERAYLIDLTTKGTCSARKITRARILLKADEGLRGEAWSDALISEALDVGTTTVERIRRKYCQEGLAPAINRKKPDRDYARTIDGVAEAHLVRLACSKPPQGRGRWTLRLLADRMVTLGYVEAVSHETVRQVLKKTC